MNLRIPPFLTVTIGFFAAAAFAQSIRGQTASSTAAQSPVSQPDQTGQGQPAITFKVLRTVHVKQGNHSIVYNLVAPPVLPVPTLTPQPIASGTDTTPEILQKDYQSVFFSVIVFDRQISAVALV